MNVVSESFPQFRAVDALKNLQATHQIIRVLELAKGKIESIIEQGPDLFLIISQEGLVLKANDIACRNLGFDKEDYLYRSVFERFNEIGRKILESNIDNLAKNKTISEVEFESQIDGADGKMTIHWKMSQFNQFSKEKINKLFTIHGRDITQLRMEEQKISDLFAIIPLGILSIDRNGMILPGYSKYTEYCFVSKNEKKTDNGFAGKSFYEVIFEPAKEFVGKIELEIVKQLPSTIGEDWMWFDSISKGFPRHIMREINNCKIKLRINYHPVILDGKVENVLLIIADEGKSDNDIDTFLAEELKANEKEVRRIVDVMKTDKMLIPATFEDFDKYVQLGAQAIEDKNARALASQLHGIKSTSRIVGFSRLANMVHDLESIVLEPKPNFSTIVPMFLDIRSEISQCRKISAIFSSDQELGSSVGNTEVFKNLKTNLKTCLSKYGRKSDFSEIENELNKIIDEANYVELSDLDAHLQKQCESTTRVLEKKVTLITRWNNLRVEPEILNATKEILTHVINNSIDHGIENPEVRKSSGKLEFGKIEITTTRKGDHLSINIRDDGLGLSRSAIVNKAEHNGMIQGDSSLMKDSDVWLLIFESKFSTSSTVSQVSGRGIGLDAVKAIISAHGNNPIEIENRPKEGVSFNFVLKAFNRGG